MNLDTLWKTALAEIELSVTKPTFQTHFAKTKLVSLENAVATISVNNHMVRNLIESRYYSLIKSILDLNTKQNVSLVFTISPIREHLSPGDAGPLFAHFQEPPALDLGTMARRLHILPQYTFDTFAVSTSNQIAYAAATAVAKSPGTAYNPLFLHGGVGVGKTHLMHAVANIMLAKKPNTKIVYCMGEEFLNEIIEAIQTKSVRLFKQKYRSAQLLLVDDVQFIAGKQTAQEEFFHTFNTVHREGGQVILTSDRPPSEISRLEERLRSRFEGGLIVDISAPDFELLTAIINIKSAALGLSIPPQAAQLIAANITNSRAIEGFLRRITTETVAGSKIINEELVSSLLTGKGRMVALNSSTKPMRRVTGIEVLDAVALYYGIKPTAMKGPKRDRPIARPRQLIMYVCKTELGLTLEDIGGLLGGRDHTTVMHGVETIARELSTNERLRGDLVGIKQKLWV